MFSEVARKKTLLVLFLLWSLLFSTFLPAQGPISYVYDDLGRLVAVIDPVAGAAIYEYDPVGNLLSIDRPLTTDVVIIEFSPKKALEGSTVVLKGIGFSAVPSENSVSFNGLSASVSSSTANEIVTAVPAGATTGPISITTPLGSDISDRDFVVGSDAPTIATISPLIGTPGTSVQITGTNFETNPADNRVVFNAALADVTSSDGTTLITSVPTAGTSGQITISTLLGRVESSDDFFVPPAPYGVSDVESTGRVSIGDTENTSVLIPESISMRVFDGLGGKRLSIKAVKISATYQKTDLKITVYTPQGATLASSGSMGTTNLLGPVVLTDSGTFTMSFDPVGTKTGTSALTYYDVPPDVTGTVTINGSAVNLSMPVPGQKGSLTFPGTSGQQVTVKLTNSTINPGSKWVRLKSADGTVLTSKFSSQKNFNLNQVTLPATETYTVEVDPHEHWAGSINVAVTSP